MFAPAAAVGPAVLAGPGGGDVPGGGRLFGPFGGYVVGPLFPLGPVATGALPVTCGPPGD